MEGMMMMMMMMMMMTMTTTTITSFLFSHNLSWATAEFAWCCLRNGRIFIIGEWIGKCMKTHSARLLRFHSPADIRAHLLSDESCLSDSLT
jgi:hypothetical protein